MTTDPAEQLLREAADIVSGARRKSYGNPEDNFHNIAELWNKYLSLRERHQETVDRLGLPPPGRRLRSRGRTRLDEIDVSVMMLLMKVARLIETPDHEDSWKDIAGYAACGFRCSRPDRELHGGMPESRGTTHGELMQMHDDAEADAEAGVYTPRPPSTMPIIVLSCTHGLSCYHHRNDDPTDPVMICSECGATSRASLGPSAPA